MSNLINLKNRSVIQISGKDRFDFLQGLVTNDVNKASDDNAIYSLMLNPQGRFLYEFFIFQKSEDLFLDTSIKQVDELVRKLGFYKLRSDVEIKKREDLKVVFSPDSNVEINHFNFIKDPRKENFGVRIYCKAEDVSDIECKIEDDYHYLRIQNKIVDENDLAFDKSIISEFGFDNLNAINYKKGCYVGQEVVARAYYKGQVRKKVFLIEVEDLDKVAKDSEITCDGKKQGIVLSSLFYENKLMALALIKHVDLQGNEIDFADKLRVLDNRICIKS